MLEIRKAYAEGVNPFFSLPAGHTINEQLSISAEKATRLIDRYREELARKGYLSLYDKLGWPSLNELRIFNNEYTNTAKLIRRADFKLDPPEIKTILDLPDDILPSDFIVARADYQKTPKQIDYLNKAQRDLPNERGISPFATAIIRTSARMFLNNRAAYEKFTSPRRTENTIGAGMSRF